MPTLGGRSVVAGYPGWLWTYGLSDWQQRTQNVERMLQGDPDTPRLLRQYGVKYVVLGPQELAEFKADQPYWEAHAQRVYQTDGYTVYRVPK